MQLNIKYNFLIAKLIDHLNLNVAKLNYHTGGKLFVHGTKRRKENQLQCLIILSIPDNVIII